MIYADNAATEKMSASAISEMMDSIKHAYGNPSSLHGQGRMAHAVMEDARKRIKKAINAADGDKIIFTSGGSEVNNQAIISVLLSDGFANHDWYIVSTKIEHHSVLKNFEMADKKIGFEVTLVNVDENGIVRPEDVEKAIREDTCLVSVMYANNEIGTIQPIREIGEICERKGVLFHTDAVQAVGHIPIDVQRDKIDLLSASGHKFGGPKGTGFLYVREGVPVSSLILGGGQEYQRRAGTENVPGIAGMAAALEARVSAMRDESRKTAMLRDRLMEGIGEIPGSMLNGDRERRLPGNVNFCFEGVGGEALVLLLDKEGICASSGSACTTGSLEPSHVLTAIGRSTEMANSALRITINAENTEEEIEQIIASVKKNVEYLRRLSAGG